MYVINVETMKLEFFLDDREPTYAILSHRWQQDEVTFQDMQTGRAHERAGYAKLKAFCEMAAAAGLKYAWCDTCCIDKSSSAELSEAINSMFRWYQNSSICYAYFYDMKSSTIDDETSNFSDCAWWKRGWCLQELLAPKRLEFLNTEWKRLGTKSELKPVICKITGIHPEALSGENLDSFSVAQRMSWASARITTRIEDAAYSLMGIFDVNMPLLYGEGERAFRRLQEEIMKQSNDQSIFVHSSPHEKQGLLARSPADFKGSSTVIRTRERLVGKPYSITNMGLHIELFVYPWTLGVYLALLDCQDGVDSDTNVAIFLKLDPQVFHPDGTPSADHAARVKFDNQAWLDHSSASKLIRLRHPLYLGHHRVDMMPSPPQHNGFWLRRFEGENAWAKGGKIRAITWNDWDSEKRVLTMPTGTFATVGILIWEKKDDGAGNPFSVILRLAFTPTFEPVIEFAGDMRLGKYDDRKGKSDQASKEALLSDMSWTSRLHAGRGNGILLTGSSRDFPLEHAQQWGVFGAVEIVCQKAVVDGCETWALDIVWQMGTEGLSKKNVRHIPRIRCDNCNNMGLGVHHHCTYCADYDLCSNCIHLAKGVHNPTHDFEERS